MLSSEDIAAIKVAIGICNDPELKREVLCAPGSDYDIKKGSNQYVNKKQWVEILEMKSAIILESLSLPAKFQEKVMGLVPFIGIRMLTWAEYHEGTFGFPRVYSMNFLSCSFFTPHGIIDNKKAAEELMNENNLSIRQKYKLACIYCFTDHIPALYRQMEQEDKEEFYDAQNPGRIKQPGLVKFWSYYLMGEIDKLREYKNISIYRLAQAIESGSQVAVQYCLEKTNLIRKKDIIIDAAVEAVRNRTMERDDWIVYRYQRYDDRKETWVPGDYYVDILCLLLSKMSDDQKIEFLKKDIEGVWYKREPFEERRRSRVLEYFLNWPYQYYFLKTTKLIWGYLPEKDCAVLLLRMCDKLEYGENRIYDYRGLLKEFWCQIPEYYKRYVFSNQEVDFRIVEAKSGVELLIKLLTLKNFTHEDRKNIELILASADDKEKENISRSKEWRNICVDLLKEEKWEILDQFVLNWFSTEEEAHRFKREMIFTKEVQRICINFVKNNKWNAAESLIKWSSASEEEINNLKIEMIHSEDGKQACRNLSLLAEGVQVINTFCDWFFSSEEEFGKFKKEWIFSDIGTAYCSYLVQEDRIELADEFTKWCLSSEEEIIKLKKNVAYIKGDFVCEELISDYSIEDIYDEKGNFTNGCMIKFKGGKWEQVEKFLTWCFTSEKEICDFKKNVLHGISLQIHFNLIKSNQWEEAEMFFAWLGLSPEEIKELKKETLFNHDGAIEMFSKLVYSEEGDEEFIDYGDKQDTIELLLRWYLTDKEAVLKFKDEFKSQNFVKVTEKQKGMFENFDQMIEQRLIDLDEEKRGVKRKHESCFTYKKICNGELNNGVDYGN